MFERLDCVALHTDDLAGSLAFLSSMGLTEAWRLKAPARLRKAFDGA